LQGSKLFLFHLFHVRHELKFAGKIQSGDAPLNVESISELVSKDSQGNEHSTDIATMALFALWVIGVVDSYREGGAREKPKESRKS